MYLFYTTEEGIDVEKRVSEMDFESALLEKRLSATKDISDVNSRIESLHGEETDLIYDISRLLKSGYGLHGEWGSFKDALEDFSGWCNKYTNEITDWYDKTSEYMKRLDPVRIELAAKKGVPDCSYTLSLYAKHGRCELDNCSCIYWTTDRFDQHGVFTPLNELEGALKAFDGIDRVKTYVDRLKAKEGTTKIRASFKYVKIGTVHGILYGVNDDGLMTGYEKIVMNYRGSGKFGKQSWERELNTSYTDVLKEIKNVKDAALKELKTPCDEIECMKSVVSVGRYRLYQMRSYKMLWLSAMHLKEQALSKKKNNG